MGEWKPSRVVREYETFSVAEDQSGYRIIEYQQQRVKHPTYPRYAVQVWDDVTKRFITVHRTSKISRAEGRLRRFVAAERRALLTRRNCSLAQNVF